MREAVLLVVNNRNLLYSITSELYPAIAQKYNTTTSRVERAIRHAIEITCNVKESDRIKTAFGFNLIPPKKGKPTNSEIIALISDTVKVYKKY